MSLFLIAKIQNYLIRTKKKGVFLRKTELRRYGFTNQRKDGRWMMADIEDELKVIEFRKTGNIYLRNL